MIFNLLCRMKQLIFGSKINMGLFLGAFLFAAMTPFFVSNGINDAVPMKVNAAERLTSIQASQSIDAEAIKTDNNEDLLPTWMLHMGFLLSLMLFWAFISIMGDGSVKAYIIKNCASVVVMGLVTIIYVFPAINLIIIG